MEERDMTDQQWLAERFEEHQSRLRAVAYRMLGSLSEADDRVLGRFGFGSVGADTGEVKNLGAWLTTIVARVALNILSSRNIRREQPA
jgi:DNA-directed RNA polymerase specialized sigma24 family protein